MNPIPLRKMEMLARDAFAFVEPAGVSRHNRRLPASVSAVFVIIFFSIFYFANS